MARERVRRRGDRPLPQLRAHRAGALRPRRHLATSGSGSSSVARPVDRDHRVRRAERALGRLGRAGGGDPARLRAAWSRRRAAARCSCRRARTGSRRRSTCSTASSSPAARTSTRPSTARTRTPRRPGTRPERDRGELALLRAALERDMPVLAVCRGSQVLNVARGGDLVQHLPEVVGDEKHKHTPGVFADHEVEVKEGTRLGSLLGERAPVKSHHHQGFGTVGDGLVESAWADDGTLEALEDPREALRRRRPLAPRGGRGRGALPRARRRGAGLPGRAGASRRPAATAAARPARRRRDGAQARRRGRRRREARPAPARRRPGQAIDRSRGCRLRRRLGPAVRWAAAAPGGERRQELAHPRVVLGDPLLELELQAGLLGHPLVELAARVADHVADQDADDEAAEERGEPVARRDRPGGAERAERDRADEDPGERADRDAGPADRPSLRLVVRDELLHGLV